MKKHYPYILLAAAFGLGLSACSEQIYGVADGEQLNPPMLTFRNISVGTDQIYLSADGEPSAVGIYSQNATWELTDIPDWVTVTPKTGGKEGDDSDVFTDVVITPTANTSFTTDRVGTMYLKSTSSGWNLNKSIALVQEHQIPYAAFNTQNIKPYITAQGGRLDIPVETNVPQLISVKISGVDDLTGWDFGFNNDKTIYHVVAPANTTAEVRYIYLTLLIDNEELWSGGDITLTITQDAPTIGWVEIDNKDAAGITFPVGARGGEYELTFNATGEWVIDNDYTSWIEYNPAAGNAGIAKVKMTVLPNPNTINRTSGWQTIKTSAGAQTFRVEQEKMTFNFTHDNIPNPIPAAGGTYQAVVSCDFNGEWEFVPDTSVPGMSADPSTGSFGDTTVNITIPANTSGSERQVKIKFGCKHAGGYSESSTTVYQAYSSFGLNTNSMSVSAAGETTELSIGVEGNNTWEATILDDSWVHMSQLTGQGPSTVEVTIDPNMSLDSRTTAISVSSGGRTSSVNVTQKGLNCSITVPYFELYASGGESDRIAITYNSDVEPAMQFSPEAPWLNTKWEQSVEGSWQNATLYITAEQNNTADYRTTELIIGPKYWPDMVDGDFATSSKAVRVPIKQEHYTIFCNTTVLSFVAAGGGSEPIYVGSTKDWKFEIIGGDWLSAVVDTSSSRITIYTKAYTGSSSRSGIVRISLVGIEGGSISHDITVTQYSTNSTIEFGPGFEQDEDWSPTGANKINLKIKQVR